MNALYPYLIPGAQGDPASFTANTTLILGTYDKPSDARTQISVDYSGIVPPDDVISYSFRVEPGGDPQLWISGAGVESANTLLKFYVSEGLEGRSYEVTIVAKLASGNIRSDVLTVNVLGDDCGCGASFPMPTYLPSGVSGDGITIVNTAPRFFVSATAPVGANLLDRWYESGTGYIYDYVTNGNISWWEKVTVGISGGGFGAQVVTMDLIMPDGVTRTFTLTAVDGTVVDIPASNTLLVSVDGVWQQALVAYEASGNQIVFAEPPSSDAKVFMLWLASPLSSSTPPPIDGVGAVVHVVTINKIIPDGVTVIFELTAVDGTIVDILASNTLLVSVDGVWQEVTVAYEASGDQITFVEPPSQDAVVFMLWLSSASGDTGGGTEPDMTMEALTVVTQNVIPPLSRAPTGTFVQLIVNGRVFCPVGVNPPFSITGQTITWLSTLYSVTPLDEVVACYS